jgi:DNA-binding transcriptional regulator YbjK
MARPLCTEFLGEMEQLFPLLKDKSVLKKILRAHRFANRLTLEEICAGAGSRAHRDAAILKACHECGYTQAQVATTTSLHHLPVSKIIRKLDNSRFKI